MKQTDNYKHNLTADYLVTAAWGRVLRYPVVSTRPHLAGVQYYHIPEKSVVEQFVYRNYECNNSPMGINILD